MCNRSSSPRVRCSSGKRSHPDSVHELHSTPFSLSRTHLGTLTNAATSIFGILATISLAWTCISMAIKRAELMEICAELCRFIMFTGLFFWLLTHGPEFGNDKSSQTSWARDQRSHGGPAGRWSPDHCNGFQVSLVIKVLDDVSAGSSGMNPPPSFSSRVRTWLNSHKGTKTLARFFATFCSCHPIG